jgi:protein kinase A
MKFAEMATAVLHHGSSATSSNDNMAETAEQDKQFVAHFDQQHPLPPSEVQQDPRNKELGRSSKGLSVHDFELVRTLGTGTFARVWLVRLANPAEEDRDKVFALKVLRKVEVIKLKQVDHVNHERSVLADVAGHPFITTLITSFSDHDSLYMLVSHGFHLTARTFLTALSSIIALVAKYSLTSAKRNDSTKIPLDSTPPK